MCDPSLDPIVSGTKSSLHGPVGKTNDPVTVEPTKRCGPSETSSTKSPIRRMFLKLRIGRRCQRSSISRLSHGSDQEHETDQKTTGSTLATEHDGSISSSDSEALAPLGDGYQGQSTATMTEVEREQQPFAAAIEEDKAPEPLADKAAAVGTATAVTTTEDAYQPCPGAVSWAPQPGSESGMRFEKLYKLKNVLGMGAYSTVREGFHRKSNDKSVSYAVKCIDRERVAEADERALLDEVSILRQLKHPNVIQLLDVFDEPAKYYVVMERVHGGELFDRICSKSYYDEIEARDCCVGLLHAIRYCHDNHIVHRDLKPENVLLSTVQDDVSVKVADFGFAKRCPRQCYLTTLCGTPGYVAPEVPMGWPYDERVDLWSIGVILYILLCGYPPFIERDQRQLFRKIIKGDYELHEEYWGTVSNEAKDLVKSLMNVDRETRLTADGALRENPWILGDCEQLERIRTALLPSSPKMQHYHYSAATPTAASSSSSKLVPHPQAVRPGQHKQQAQHDMGAAAAALSIASQISKKVPVHCQHAHQHQKQDTVPPASVTIRNNIIKRTPAAVAA